jgi:hypothetical protein
MDFHHDRIKGDVERVVMHSRVSLKSYNVNAQVIHNLMTVIKVKTLNGAVCTSACLCLRTMLDLMMFREVVPQKLGLGSS